MALTFDAIGRLADHGEPIASDQAMRAAGGVILRLLLSLGMKFGVRLKKRRGRSPVALG